MKHLFLTSNMGCVIKENGIRYSTPINNTNGIVERIKESLKKEETILFFASDPTDYEKNDTYCPLIFESFNKSGFNFKNYKIVDDRYTGNLKEDINNADIVFLNGGHTPTQMKFFEKIHLRELLKNHKGVIIGQSAGSLNMAELVVCAPEYVDEIGSSYTWKGLGLTKINIEPHFVTEELTNPEDILFKEELMKLSDLYKIYAILDGTDIYDDGKTQTMYGEGYILEKRKIKKICNNKEKITL